MLYNPNPAKMPLKRSKALKKIYHVSALLLAASLIVTVYGFNLILESGYEVYHLIHAGAERLAFGHPVAELVEGITIFVHYFLVSKFLVHSFGHGFPISKAGGKEIRIIGWETILLPMLANIIRIIYFASTTPIRKVIHMEVFEIVLGVTIILMGYVLEYGAEKIARGHRGHEAIRYIKATHPEIIEEAKEALIEQGFDSEEIRNGGHWYE